MELYKFSTLNNRNSQRWIATYKEIYKGLQKNGKQITLMIVNNNNSWIMLYFYVTLVCSVVNNKKTGKIPETIVSMEGNIIIEDLIGSELLGKD